MKVIYFYIAITIFFIFTGCQTVERKSEEIIKKEEQRLEKFINKSVNNLKINLGTDFEEIKSSNKIEFMVYKSKKFGIKCVRKFEIKNDIVIGYSSSGCF